MSKILVVIDMQNDFVDGALGTTPARHKAAIEVMKSCQVEVINE